MMRRKNQISFVMEAKVCRDSNYNCSFLHNYFLILMWQKRIVLFLVDMLFKIECQTYSYLISIILIAKLIIVLLLQYGSWILVIIVKKL